MRARPRRRSGRGARPSPGARSAGVPAPSAPRASSRRTASSTCSASGPSSTTQARSCSIGWISPTTVGLPVGPPRARAELRGAEPRNARGGHGRPSRRVDLARVAQALRHREHGRQRDLDVLRAVVVLELEAEVVTEVLEPAHPAGEGEVQQLGQLGSDLAGLAVERIEPEQHEVVGAGHPHGGGQRPRRGQGVGAGERGVAEMQTRVGPPRDRLAEDVLCARRPERHDGARAAGLAWPA